MTRNQCLKIVHFNTQSLYNKFEEFRQCILDLDYDVIAITESWLNDNISDEMINLQGYALVRRDRITETRGGGIMLYVRIGLSFVTLPSDRSKVAIEQQWIKISLKEDVVVVGNIYRRQEFSSTDFLDALESMISYSISISNNIIIVGDLNINLLASTPLAVRLLSLLNTTGLKQLVNEPTRITPHSSSLIDLVIVNEDQANVSAGVHHDYKISDHYPVFCVYPIIHQPSPRNYVFRDFRNFNLEPFNSDLESVLWRTIYTFDNIEDKAMFLSDNIVRLFDLHAPLRSIKISKPYLPWITENVKFMIKLRNLALNRFKRTRSPVHWEYYKQLRNYVTGDSCAWYS